MRADRVPISDERVWVSVLADAKKALTLREDGTLWQWGFPSDPAENPGSANASRFSRRVDWAGVVNHLNGFAGLARDGSLWSWERFDPANHYTRRSERLGFLPVLGPSRVPSRLGTMEKPPETR
ncbi:MAG: hypothetical protein FJ405_01595 [Verrucomicrobia bacterium]|nr:hypothetical protein [Verrucomicrobiota bacterium]